MLQMLQMLQMLHFAHRFVFLIFYIFKRKNINIFIYKYLYIPKKSFLLPPFNKSKQSTLRPITLHQPPKIKSNKSNKSNICNICNFCNFCNF